MSQFRNQGSFDGSILGFLMIGVVALTNLMLFALGLGVFDDTASDDEQESSEEDVSDVDIINEANLSPNEDSSSADDSPNRRKDNKTGITNSVIHVRNDFIF